MKHHHNNLTENKPVKEKLQILIRHWQEHNNSHLKEYKKWQEQVRKEGLIDIEELLKEICKKVDELSELYREIEKLIIDE